MAHVLIDALLGASLGSASSRRGRRLDNVFGKIDEASQQREKTHKSQKHDDDQNHIRAARVSEDAYVNKLNIYHQLL